LANDPGLGCGADKSNFTQLWQCSQRNGQQRSSAAHASRRHHQGASLQPRPDRERREFPHSSWTEASCSEHTSHAGERRLFRECPTVEALGLFPRWCALALFAFLLPATIVSHSFWLAAGTPQLQGQLMNFSKNVAIWGGLIFIAGITNTDACKGRCSMPNRRTLP
jgi:hypothetical protein